MTNSENQTLSLHHPEEDEDEGGEEPEEQEVGGGQNPSQAHEWETMARAWVCAFPEAKAVTAAEVEKWIDSNTGSLPTDLQSMPRSDLVDRLLSIQDYLRPPPPPPVVEGLQHFDSPSSPKVESVDANDMSPFPGCSLRDIPKDSELYLAKRNEALQKYQILLALEKKLSPHFSKRPAVEN